MKRPFKNNGAPKTNNAKLTEKQTQFLIILVDHNPCITVSMAREQLCNMVQGLSISESGLRKHMKEEIRLSLENSSIYTMDRDVTRTIELRYKIMTEWRVAGVDFQKNCMFIDEAGFNSH